VQATTATPPLPDPRPNGVIEVGPQVGSGLSHARVARRSARAGLPRPLFSRDPPWRTLAPPLPDAPHAHPGHTLPPLVSPRFFPHTPRRIPTALAATQCSPTCSFSHLTTCRPPRVYVRRPGGRAVGADPRVHRDTTAVDQGVQLGDPHDGPADNG